jgi:two-component system sensor histidine kinase KdpD
VIDHRPDPDALLGASRTRNPSAARPAQDLLRRGRRGGQDVRDAGGRAGAPRRRRRRGRRLRRDRTAARRPRRCSTDCEILPAAAGRVPRRHAPRLRPRRRARAPSGLVVVDELAHTNAPGSGTPSGGRTCSSSSTPGSTSTRRERAARREPQRHRGQDHRAWSSETVPDSVFEDADELELIDLRPTSSWSALAEGKVYVPRAGPGGRAATSSARATSSRCASSPCEGPPARGRPMRVYRRTTRSTPSGPRLERLLVCVGPSRIPHASCGRPSDGRPARRRVDARDRADARAPAGAGRRAGPRDRHPAARRAARRPDRDAHAATA